MHYLKYTGLNNTYITEKYRLSEKECNVASQYPAQISGYYEKLIKSPGDPVWMQCMPDSRELNDPGQSPDPLNEMSLSPVPGLIHRYPDRVVMLVSNRCPVYCRFCMRKRLIGNSLVSAINETDFDAAIDYISSRTEINDVILSGGDPLMLSDETLYHMLLRIRSISHISVIRIGSRVPVTLPERITTDLCRILKQFHPLYINTHFNHPVEITNESSLACSLLADSGIVLGNQTVLLKGVNDDVDVMRKLMTGLLKIRVKPYYLHQMDLVKGTAHFRTPVSKGIEIINGLRGHVSGLAVPHFVIDLPGGKGKVAVVPEIMERRGDELIFKTYDGEMVAYRDIKVVQE